MDPGREGFQPTIVNDDRPPSETADGMVWIPGGEFSMGAAPTPGMHDAGMQATHDSRHLVGLRATSPSVNARPGPKTSLACRLKVSSPARSCLPSLIMPCRSTMPRAGGVTCRVRTGVIPLDPAVALKVRISFQ